MQDILTKFNEKKRLWMTPKHSFYLRPSGFKEYYGAALFLQAGRSGNGNVLNNTELERILQAGMGLSDSQITTVMQLANEESDVLDHISDMMVSEHDKILFMLDLLAVSYTEEGWDIEADEWIDLWERILGIYSKWSQLLRDFMAAVRQEDQDLTKELADRIYRLDADLSESELKFYGMPLGKETICTQKQLEQDKELHLVDRSEIHEDLVLRSGMRLVIDHAEVRVYGNIALEGGELLIEKSKIIRKTNRHRACINIHTQGSRLTIRDSVADCRNFGMFIRAEDGTVEMTDSKVYRTTRGAAVRFWGERIRIERSRFVECYSPEDGGALMLRGGTGEIKNCYFRDCEANRGGAIYCLPGIAVHHCHFEDCCVSEYGAAVFYNGMIGKAVHHLEYADCHPTGAELVQYLYHKAGITVTDQLRIQDSVIIDCPVDIKSQGALLIENANVYLNHQIRCRGTLKMENSRIVCGSLEKGDMMVLDHAKHAEICHCDFDGMLRTGAIHANGTKLRIRRSVFRNTQGGRAIYNAYAPDIQDSIFNFCQGGAVYTQGGTLKRCVFINCREKNGAGIRMYGNTPGLVEQCNFKRCVADSRGGAVDRGIGHKVRSCLFEDCQPDNVY